MNTALLVYCGLLTFFTLGTIYYYEDKLKKNSTPDYLNTDRMHYTYLQLENQRLKEEILKLTPIQYEHKNEFGEK